MFSASVYSIFVLTLFLLAGHAVSAVPRVEIFDSYGEKIDSMEYMPLTFDSLQEPIMGLTALARPANACQSIAEPHYFFNVTIFRFVLINGTSYDDCFGYTKVKNAEEADFDLAIIYVNSYMQPNIVYRYHNIGIPVILLNLHNGLKIINAYLYNNRTSDVYFLKVLPSTADMSYYIMLFSIVIAVCLVAMVSFMICLLIKCIQERRRTMRNRLSSRQIRQLPTETFKPGDQYDICAICLEDYKEGDKLRILPCAHAYHTRCIDPWLTENKRNCPLCKRKIRVNGSTSDSESDSELASPAENTPLLGGGATNFHQQSTSTGSDNGGCYGSFPGANQYYINQHGAGLTDMENAAVTVSPHGSINNEASLEHRSCDTPDNEEGHANRGLLV